MKDPLFEEMEKDLAAYGYLSAWFESRQEAPYPHLLVRIPADDKNRERSLILKLEQKILSLPFELKNETPNSESFVQIISAFPFPIPSEVYWNVFRILNFFNLSLSTPCLLLDEANHKVIIRYSFLHAGSKIAAPTLVSLLGMTLLFLDVFSDPIEEVAHGKSIEETIAGQIESLFKNAA